ncbi:MAG: hypothetical protein IKV85_04800 [Ruminococcus sp.]|nr:hypothetical protein [Ruminococcus sp.]
MKKILSVVFLIVGILIAAVGGVIISGIAFGGTSSESIGIIGGADGPTAIFLISRLGIFPIAALVVGIAIIIISAIGIKKNKSK